MWKNFYDTIFITIITTLGSVCHHSCKLVQGSTAIAALVRQAQGRISIMAGGGVRPKNVESLIRLTAVSEVHSACSRSASPCVHLIL